MAFCSACGGEVSRTAAFCRHCGGSLDDPVGVNSDAEPARDRGGCRKVFKWIAICLACLVGAFVILIIVVAILTDTDENGERFDRDNSCPRWSSRRDGWSHRRDHRCRITANVVADRDITGDYYTDTNGDTFTRAYRDDAYRSTGRI